MASLILIITAIINATTNVVEATVTVLRYVKGGKRRRKHEKTGKHSRS